MAQLKDLLVNGSSRFIGDIYGNLKGNADTATNADNATTADKVKSKLTIKIGSTTIAYDGSSANTATITPSAIGAAASDHTHTKSQITDFAHNHNELYYTETEIDTKLSTLLGANNAMVFKGAINKDTDLPAKHSIGWTYWVNTAGTYASKTCEVGDLIICIIAGDTANKDHWIVAQTNIDGAVIGPNTSTANAVPTFVNETGKVIKNNPAVTINETGLFTAPYIATGLDGSHYFQSAKFRGEGDANTYYHAVDFGYAGHNQVDFHEYGGIWNFYKNTKGTAAGGELIASIQPNGLKVNGYIQTTAENKAGDFATIGDNGQIYKRTAAQARQDMGLSTAMHFIGKATVDIADGSTVDPKITGYTTKTAGDVIIDKNNSYEYVWTLEGKWERLGPDGSYSVVGHTHDYLPLSGGTLTGDLQFADSSNKNCIRLGTLGYSDYESLEFGDSTDRPNIWIQRPGSSWNIDNPRDINLPSDAPALSISDRTNDIGHGSNRLTFYISKHFLENGTQTGFGRLWLRSYNNKEVQLKGIYNPEEDSDATNKYYVDNQISTKNTSLKNSILNTVSSTYVKKTGDTMTGNLVVGSSSIGTNGYIEGTWLKTTANISSDKAGNFAIVRDGGWIYSRTPAQARQDMGLSTAMHFIGKATVDITDGSTVDPKINGYTTKTAGDVIIDKNNSYEYVWTLEGKWERLGPDSSYSVVGHNHDDRYSTAISITIPKGRMRGDVDGDGKITENDANLMFNHVMETATLTGADLWCADINGDGLADSNDYVQLNRYLQGRPGNLTTTPMFADYYNNWTYVKVDNLTGYWTTEIATSGITTQNDIIINIFDLFSLGQFYKADILTNKIKLYATRPPIEDLKALITIRPGSGRVSIPAYSPEITLSSLGAAAQDHSHNSIYVKKTGDTMTGNLAIEKSSNSTSFTTTRTDTGSSVSFMVGSDGTNRGVYDNNLNAWIIYSDGTDARTQLKLYGAVWNDYAEFREGDTIEPGKCVIEVGDDTLITSTERMMPGANITSDTFGFAIGETEQAKTPIAVSGRVLAYPYESREEFKKNIGRPICSGPNGTVSIMTDEEYRDKGYCAIGTISAVPDYEEWGTGKVKVNGRVWIKVF